MPKISKVIVTNSSALKAKYLKHYPRVKDAIDALIKANVGLRITTRLVALDDGPTMKRMGAAPVLDPEDHRANKAAIDAVWNNNRPDYILIIGAPDIVAHQNLFNPVYAPGDDDDRFAPSDLPYACDAPYSQQIADFRGPTRVVGRLPGLHQRVHAQNVFPDRHPVRVGFHRLQQVRPGIELRKQIICPLADGHADLRVRQLFRFNRHPLNRRPRNHRRRQYHHRLARCPRERWQCRSRRRRYIRDCLNGGPRGCRLRRSRRHNESPRLRRLCDGRPSRPRPRRGHCFGPPYIGRRGLTLRRRSCRPRRPRHQ